MKISAPQFETASLFLLDGLANVIDFAFHFWMGRVLIPADFAVLQTLNSIALVYVAASGVFQPVVGRFIAEARGREQLDSIPAIFQTFFRAAFTLGTILSILVFSFSTTLAHLLNLPAWTIQVSAALIFLGTLRPIAAGVLQGEERFLAFGIARLALSLGRILFIVLLLPTGINITGAIIALPFGWLVSLFCAFLFLRVRNNMNSLTRRLSCLCEGALVLRPKQSPRWFGDCFAAKNQERRLATTSQEVNNLRTLSGENLFKHKENLWKGDSLISRPTLVNFVRFAVKSFRLDPTHQNILREGWKLSAYALLAYFAYMSLTSLDLVWVNRTLDGESAGAYASLVLMRRIVALLPGAAVTVMFPRIAKMLAQGHRPDRLLIQTAGIVFAASGALTILYFLFSDQLISLIFGNVYRTSSSLLGWMGIATIGVSLSSIWLNYHLAERPRNFVVLLLGAVALEWILLERFPASMQQAVVAFGATGWALAISGFMLYLFSLHRRRSLAPTGA